MVIGSTPLWLPHSPRSSRTAFRIRRNRAARLQGRSRGAPGACAAGSSRDAAPQRTM